MELTNREIKTIKAVFNSLLMTFQDYELNRFMGSETIERMKALERKLYYSDYCEKNGIIYEEMTEDDFMREYEERMCW